MNQYLKNLSKIEFAITYACTGRCKHCSEGDHNTCGQQIDPEISADAVRKIASRYSVKTLMVFGGEPLLYPKTVYRIMSTGREMGIPKRQIITNGYFGGGHKNLVSVADGLLQCGVNDLLLSVDAFHQETIPKAPVKEFALEIKSRGIPIKLSPAWLVGKDNENPYNKITKEIVKDFEELGIATGEGNVIFPEGNALKYLSEYFKDGYFENPYTEDPKDVKCVSFSPNGDVLDGNVYKNDVLDILKNYTPY